MVSTPFAPQQVQVSGGTESSDQWTHFEPHQNLAPLHLEQGVTHLEVSKFVDSMKTYITVGFCSVVPPKGVWMYVAPFLASSWWASMKSRGVQAKSFEKILEAIMGKSALSLSCPMSRPSKKDWVSERKKKQQHPHILLTEDGRNNWAHRIWNHD